MSTGSERIRKYLVSIDPEFTLEYILLHRIMADAQEIHQDRLQWHYLKEKTSDYVVVPAKAGIQDLKKTSADRPILDAGFRRHDGGFCFWVLR